MRRVSLVFMAYALCSNTLYATHVVDLYGADKNQSKFILEKYAKQVVIIQSELDKERKIGVVSDKDNSEKIEKVRADKYLLEVKISYYLYYDSSNSIIMKKLIFF